MSAIESSAESGVRRFAKRCYWALTLKLPARLREERAAERIRASGFFDEVYYRSANPDVAQAGVDPITHYVASGAAEGRRPHRLFDGARYLAENPDVAASRRNPLDHFVTAGWREGRHPQSLFPKPPCTGENDADRASAAAHVPAPRVALRSIPGAAARDALHAASDDPVIVVVSHVCPVPARAGNELRIARYVRWLESRGNRVLFVCCPLGGEELDDPHLARAAAELTNFIHCTRDGDVAYALDPAFERMLGPIDGMTARPLSGDEAARSTPAIEWRPDLAALEISFCPDVLLRVLLLLDSALPDACAFIPTYVFNSRYLPLLRPGRFSVLDTIDVFSTKQAKVQRFGVDDGLALRPDEERALLQRADVIMAIQPDEARDLEALVPEQRVIDVGIDFEPLPGAFVPLPDPGEPKRVLLIGSANPMNVKGLEDVVAFVWPRVVDEHPEAELWVGGALSAFVPEETPNVVPLGSLESLAEIYRACHLAINPAVAGTGIKIKTLESLASWRPIVTWPAGVDGLPHELRSLCVVAHDLYEFGLSISKCLAQERTEAFDAEARGRIRYALSSPVIYRELGAVLDERLRPSPTESR